MKNIYLRSFSGVIWKLLIDRQFQQLFLEIRSEQSLDIAYFHYDIDTSEAVQHDLPGDIDWWSRPVHFHDQKIIVQKYEDQSNPGPGPVYLIDLRSNTSEKLADKFLINQIGRNEVSGTKFVKEDEKESAVLRFSTSAVDERETEIYFPELYQEGSEDFETVATFIERKKAIRPILGIEYFEKEDHLFFTYYLKGHNISRFIMVLKNGELLIDQCIDRKVKGLSTESFFILANKLIFVEDRITLQVYEING